MDITTFEIPIVVIGCWCLGQVVKLWVKDVDNKFIPTICAVAGVLLNVWINGAFTPEILIGGMVSGLASTGANELIKQLRKSTSTESDGTQA